MGIFVDTFNAIRSAVSTPDRPPMSVSSPGFSLGADNSYQAHARAYIRNEVVNAAIRLLGTSAGEPEIIGRRWRRESPRYGDVRSWAKSRHAGYQARVRNEWLIQNGFIEQVPGHPLVQMMNNPNPYMTRAKLMRILVMDRFIDGNWYVYKARGELGNVMELWRLRPDRVKIILDDFGLPAAYAYKTGNQTVIYPADDVIHGSEPHPLNDWVGLSPLDPIMPRVAIDDAMRDFLGSFFLGGGTGPGSILTVSGKLSDTAKAEIRARLKQLINGTGAFRETLILDQGTSSYERLGLDRGLTDAVPKDVNAVNEARLGLPFTIPGSILGLLIGYESSSYANKRADWQVLWDITMTPLLSDFDDEFTKSLCPEFAGIDELLFNLGDIRALQEDEDSSQDRHRKNFQAGGESWEEFRAAIGLDPEPKDGLFFVPSNYAPTWLDDLGNNPDPPAPPPAVVSPVDASGDDASAVAMALQGAFRPVALLEAPRRGRRPLVEDSQARALWESGERLRKMHPSMTLAQIAKRIGVAERTYRQYRSTFGE